MTFAWQIESERPTGPVVRHRFSSQGTFPVTLTVSDGFETTTGTLNVTVRAGGTNGGELADDAPGPGAWVVALLSVSAALARRRRHPGTTSLK